MIPNSLKSSYKLGKIQKFKNVAYIYRHIRKDSNKVFYIGIGRDAEGKYKRAVSKADRNLYWKRVTSKADYIVQIVLDDLTWEEACEKEKEFISLYGRRDLGLGTLTNLTNGGEGLLGHKHSENALVKMRQPRSEEGRLNIQKSHLNKDGTLKTKSELWVKTMKTPRSKEVRKKISQGKKGKPQPWVSERCKGKPLSELHIENKSKQLIDPVTGLVFKGCWEAATFYGVCRATISNYVKKGILKSTK